MALLATMGAAATDCVWVLALMISHSNFVFLGRAELFITHASGVGQTLVVAGMLQKGVKQRNGLVIVASWQATSFRSTSASQDCLSQRVALIIEVGSCQKPSPIKISQPKLNPTGYCSPSAGLKFTDIPNGLAALSKVGSELPMLP